MLKGFDLMLPIQPPRLSPLPFQEGAPHPQLRNPVLYQSGAPVVNTAKVQFILSHLKPLSFRYCDSEGRIIQIWKTHKNTLVGGVLDKQGHLQVVPAHKIRNPMCPDGQNASLLERLEAAELRRWDLVFDPVAKTLTIWPHLIASGKDNRNTTLTRKPVVIKPTAPIQKTDVVCWQRPSSNIDTDRLRHIFRNGDGHFERDTHENRAYILNAVSSPAYKVGVKTERRGKVVADIYLKIMPDGTQAWAEVHNGKIINGGRNSQPQVWHPDVLNPSGGRFVPLKLSLSALAYDQMVKTRWLQGNLSRQLGGDPTNRNWTIAGPSVRQFHQLLQQTRLTDSYNALHANHPVPPKGARGGEIGGVGMTAEIIQGLFDSPEALFEREHLFYFPQGESLPFSNEELRQILRELAIGIYVHDTVPFFSLHFQQDANLFPVIHPVYEKTLVGRVISMLDYMMKGYLNGGVFQEAFVQDWYRHPEWNSGSAVEKMIDFEKYCREHLQGLDKEYISLHDLKHIYVDSANASDEDKFFADFSKFTNSFRIIAKQKSFQRTDNMFVLDCDFDVRYTIEAPPKYKKALELFHKMHGCYPRPYQRMIEIYQETCQKIHDHMVKLPLCREYFSMLGVINFLSCYFTTLKNHRKVPVLPTFHTGNVQGSPALFPCLPIRETQDLAYKVDVQQIAKQLCQDCQPGLVEYLAMEPIAPPTPSNPSAAPDTSKLAALAIVEETIMKTIARLSGPSVRFLIENDPEKFRTTNKLWLIVTSDTLLLTLKKSFQLFCAGKFDSYLNSSLSEKDKRELKQAQKFLTGQDHKSQKDREMMQPHMRTVLNKALPLILNMILPQVMQGRDFNFTRKQTMLNIQPSLPPGQLEREKALVGGCSITMESRAVLPSIKGEIILQEQWTAIRQAESETWVEICTEDEQRTGSVFRLGFQDATPDMDDYRWMESLLLVSGPEEERLMQNMQEILSAFSANNQQLFKELIQQSSSDLKKMRDREGRGLLHYTAMGQDVSYTKSLLHKGLTPTTEDGQGYLPIHYAAMRGRVEQIQLLEKEFPQTRTAKSKNSATPLIVAAQYDHLPAVKELRNGSDHKARIKGGYMALHCALHEGHKEVAKELLHGADSSLVNAHTENGVTPLMLASELDSKTLIEALLAKGADARAKTKSGTTALEISVRQKCPATCALLLPKSEITDEVIETALERGSLEMIELLTKQPHRFLEYRSNLGDTTLIIAVRNATIPVAMYLAKLGKKNANFLNARNKVGETALKLALSGGLSELAGTIQKSGAKPPPREHLIDLCRADYSYSYLLEEFLDKESGLTEEDLKAALQVAAESGQTEAIRLLVEKKKVKLEDFRAPSGWRILHYLAKANDGIDLFFRQMQKSADLLQRVQGKTLAYIAAEHGNWAVLNYLLIQMAKKSLPLERQFNDRHLLYGVLESENVECINLVLDHVQDVDIPLDDQGTRAVHLAAKMGSEPLLALLHGKGADLSIEDRLGHSPLSYAVRLESNEAVAFLLNKRRQVPITAEAIYAAAKLQKDTMMQALLQSGGKIDVRSVKSGNTAILMAVRSHDNEAFFRLVQRNASLDDVALDGWTPLLLASATGQEAVLKSLVGKVPAAQQFHGNNALHLACIHGHPACIRILVEAGYDTTMPNQEGYTPIELARGRPGVLHALGQKQENYARCLASIQDALKKHDIAALDRLLSELPVNERIQMQFNGRMITGTALHFLISFCGQPVNRDSLKAVLTKLLKNPAVDLGLQDSDGNTLAHLLCEVGISPAEIDHERFDHWLKEEEHPEPGQIAKRLIRIRDFFLAASNERISKELSSIKKDFNALPTEIRQQIYMQLGILAKHPQDAVDFGKNHLFDDMRLFCKAISILEIVRQAEQARYQISNDESPVRTLLRLRDFLKNASKEEIDRELPTIQQDFNTLPQGIREQVYAQVCAQAKKPLKDFEYGKKHLFDDISRFCKAISILDCVREVEELRYKTKDGEPHSPIAGTLARICSFLELASSTETKRRLPAIKRAFDALPQNTRSQISEQIRKVSKGSSSNGHVVAGDSFFTDAPRFRKAIESLKLISQSEYEYYQALEQGRFESWLRALQRLETQQLFCPYSNRLIINPVEHKENNKIIVERDAIQAAESRHETEITIHGQTYALRDFDHAVSASEKHMRIEALKKLRHEFIQGVDLRARNYSGRTPLSIAAINGPLEALRSMIDSLESSDIDACDNDGTTPLILAATVKQKGHVDLLLKAGANPNHRNHSMISPLFAGCSPGSLPIVKTLVNGGANVNQIGLGKTPILHYAIEQDDAISLYLLHNGADCVATDRLGNSADHIAARKGKVTVLRLMAGREIDLQTPNYYGLQAMHLAAHGGHIDCLSMLHSAHCEIDAPLSLPEIESEPTDDETIASLPAEMTSNLLSVQRSLNLPKTPMQYASSAGQLDAVRWLLDHRADLKVRSENGRGTFSFAAVGGSKSLIQLFAKSPLAQDPEQVTSAAVTAIGQDHVDSVAKLYPLGIPVDIHLMTGWSGLHLACAFGALHSTQLLLQAEADPTLQNDEGQTAFEIAAANKSVEQFQLLLDHCCPNLNQTNDRDETLLHIAARAGNLKHVMLLICYGASLDLQDAQGFTPLHIAARAGNIDIAELLLFSGANSSQRTYNGKLPGEVLSRSDLLTGKAIESFENLRKDAKLGETLFHLSIKAKNRQAVILHLRLKKDINAQDGEGVSPLHLAVRTRQHWLIRQLLKEEAEIDLRDAAGHTPLWIACLEIHDPVLAKFLVKAGADPSITDQSGNSITKCLQGLDLPVGEKSSLIKAIESV